MISWWNQWCDVAVIWLAFVVVMTLLRLSERKSSGAGCPHVSHPAPVLCLCADPILDSIGECQSCHRKPRSELAL